MKMIDRQRLQCLEKVRSENETENETAGELSGSRGVPNTLRAPAWPSRRASQMRHGGQRSHGRALGKGRRTSILP